MDEKIVMSLLKRASDIRKNAYAPYSKFMVGCAILLEDGRVVEGVNIENASFSLCLCADRAAMAPIVTAKEHKTIKAIAVVTSASPPGSPCGPCRQFLGEFLGPEVPIVFG